MEILYPYGGTLLAPFVAAYLASAMARLQRRRDRRPGWGTGVFAIVVALLVAFRGLTPLRIFIGYFLTNGLVFLLIFVPLLSRKWPVPVLELLIVLIDGFCLKTLASLSTFQGDEYRGVSWLRSVTIAAIGNAASWFVGVVASHKPWESVSNQ